MRNGHVARACRQGIAKVNANNRAQRSDQQQIDWLRRAGHTATREIARLKARIKGAKETKE